MRLAISKTKTNKCASCNKNKNKNQKEAAAISALVFLWLLACQCQLASSSASTDREVSASSSSSSPTSTTPTSNTRPTPSSNGSAAASDNQQQLRSTVKSPSASSWRNQHHSGSSWSSSSSAAAAAATRQSPISLATSLVGALANMVPGLITNVAPLVLLFGVGALMMPALGLSAASLTSRRSAPAVDLANQGQATTAFQWLQPGAFQLQQPTLLDYLYNNNQHQVRPIQAQPQEFYTFTKRSMGPNQERAWPTINSNQVIDGLQSLIERVSRAIENADKQYNNGPGTGPSQN